MSARWFPRLKTDKELGRRDRREVIAREPDITICPSCGEHCGWEVVEEVDGNEHMVSECCGVSPRMSDFDWGDE